LDWFTMMGMGRKRMGYSRISVWLSKLLLAFPRDDLWFEPTVLL
jgi:hypothetical protein